MKNKHETNMWAAIADASQDWAGFEQGVRDTVKQLGGDVAMADYVCERLKLVYLEVSHGLDLHIADAGAGTQEAVSQLNQFHICNNTILWGRLAFAYMELYAASQR